MEVASLHLSKEGGAVCFAEESWHVSHISSTKYFYPRQTSFSETIFLRRNVQKTFGLVPFGGAPTPPHFSSLHQESHSLVSPTLATHEHTRTSHVRFSPSHHSGLRAGLFRRLRRYQRPSVTFVSEEAHGKATCFSPEP
ncbi:unnamed protein product [Ectocarpus sp. 12 AP-2014]